MTVNEHTFLRAEISELQGILAEIPQDRVIDRLSFESRLKTARERLMSLGDEPVTERLLLTFRGRPVSGVRGILADFGSKAVENFTSAVKITLSSLNNVEIGDRGRLAANDCDQLMITGTAVGSFGFELEVPDTPSSLFEGENNAGASDAVESIRALFETASKGTDDDLTELVDIIHPRAVKKISEFLTHLEQNGSSCGLQFKGKSFKFGSPHELSRALSKLKDPNVHEDQVTLRGYFDGFLPHSRIFEFITADRQEVIKGKIGSRSIDATALSDEYLGSTVSVTFQTVRVGEGKPKYTLMNRTDIQSIEADD